MVFYIIAYMDSKVKSEEASGQKVRAMFNPALQRGRDINELYDYKVGGWSY
jgi:hypothetical protein